MSLPSRLNVWMLCECVFECNVLWVIWINCQNELRQLLKRLKRKYRTLLTTGLGCISIYWLNSLCTKGFHTYYSFSRYEGYMCRDSDGVAKKTSWIRFEYLCFMHFTLALCIALSLFARCWSALHHIRICLPLAILYPSPLYPCDSTLWFTLGKGACPTINYRTTGGCHPLWGRLFWILGGPESLKWSVLRSACWEKGGYSWRQRVRVGTLMLKSSAKCHLICSTLLSDVISLLWEYSSQVELC